MNIDNFFMEKDSEIKKYCLGKNIPYEDDEKTV
jgi:hypothetical protein